MKQQIKRNSGSETIAAYVKKNAAAVLAAQKHKHGNMESVRKAIHKGHQIVVRTWYEIEIDGQMLMGHVAVTNDGDVYYHPIPNLSFASAIDLVKQLIDVFPDDFRKRRPHSMIMSKRGPVRR